MRVMAELGNKKWSKFFVVVDLKTLLGKMGDFTRGCGVSIDDFKAAG